MIPVAVWLPEDQLLIRAIDTGGVPPVRSMIAHAFSDAAEGGLDAIVLEGPGQASGPLHIMAGVATSVIEETRAFLTPHGFDPVLFTLPAPPAGLDHVPVIAAPGTAARAPIALWKPAAAAAAVLAVLGGAALLGALNNRERAPEPLAENLIQPVSLSAEPSPGRVVLSLNEVTTAPRPRGPRTPAPRNDAGFTVPAHPGPAAPALSEIANLAPPAPDRTSPNVSAGAGATPSAALRSSPALDIRDETPLGFAASPQTSVASLSPPESGTAIDAPTAITHIVSRPDTPEARSLTGISLPEPPDLSALMVLRGQPAPAVSFLAGDTLLASLTPLARASLPPTAPGAPNLSRDIAALAPGAPPEAAAPRPPAPATPPVPVIESRPDIVPPARPATEQTDPEDSDVAVIAARPDNVPPPRPADDAAQEGENPAPDSTSAPEDEGEATPEIEVAVIAERPDIVPPRRPAEATPEDQGSGVRVIASLPDIVPPRRPAPETDSPSEETSAPDAPTGDNDAASAIAALIEEAGEADLSASDAALTATTRPLPRPDAIVTAEIRRQEALEKAEEERRAALQPSDLALTRAIAPRKRPRDLESPTIASLSSGGADATATPAPEASTPRRTAPQLPTSASVARAATIENAMPMRQMVLIGVYGKSGSRHALLRLSNGRFVKVERGDTVSGYSVSAISADAIRLQRGGRDTLLVIPD